MEAVTSNTFADAVLGASEPVLVDFWGPQCQPCLALMPAVERLAETYAGKVKIVKINARENPRLCIQLKVFGLPTFLLFKDGQEVTRIAGDNVSAAELEKLIRQVV